MKKIVYLAFGLTILGFIILLPLLFLSGVRPAVPVNQRLVDSLVQLTSLALEEGDYPDAALLLYGDRIIGSGYNTIKADTLAYGHAEIMAIAEAFSVYGREAFGELDRDSLLLLSTFEPCEMCKGMIKQKDIRRVYYLQSKSPGIRLKYIRQDLSYYLRLRRMKSGGSQ
ncbi:MAG: hypothetical protein CSA96_02485 [Bacteroidetes bacterium]|nr:MAG: hypothetical protein CSA96_02485 [Bacteroidota bacterium]